MFCPNCGIQIPDDARFCSDCGTVLTPENEAAQAAPEAAPVSQPAPVAAPEPAPQAAPAPELQFAPTFAAAPTGAPSSDPSQSPVVFIPEQKNNILCTVGFVGSLFSIYLGGMPSAVFLIISIIGLVQTKQRNERGRGLAIAGIIISSVFTATIIIGIICAVIVKLNE
ncbi:MAG: zinc-ribbon domain-containing protein [Clostridiales bacterium]|nr:zinc-ribbon domain-containing protein [Clostridiales bacterium]